jgi:hypothetical protein
MGKPRMRFDQFVDVHDLRRRALATVEQAIELTEKVLHRLERLHDQRGRLLARELDV